MPGVCVRMTPCGAVTGTPPPSPTLFSALCWATAVLYGRSEAQAMAEELTCTGAFPLLQADGACLRFYPMPVFALPVRRLPDRTLPSKQQATRTLSLTKRLKGAQYLSESLFKQFVEGEWNADGLLQELEAERLVLRGGCLMHAEEAQRFGLGRGGRDLLTTEDITHNEIDRWTLAVAEGRLFLREATFFAPQVGLWFGVHAASPKRLERLPALLRFLSDTGVGGERTSGKGQFEFQQWDVAPTPPAPPTPRAWVSLSHYLPDSQDLHGWNTPPRYQLVHWQAKYEAMYAGGLAVYKPLRRLFAPGSVFPYTQTQEVYGRAVPSGERLGHTVWVCGRAIPALSGGEV
jgi:CRISPR type III-A-associated RAMP protein Csm4